MTPDLVECPDYWPDWLELIGGPFDGVIFYPHAQIASLVCLSQQPYECTPAGCQPESETEALFANGRFSGKYRMESEHRWSWVPLSPVA